MTDHKGVFSNPKGGSAIGVRVVTRCATTELAGKNKDGSIEVRLTATSASTPEANQELMVFLAGRLGIGSDKIEVVLGAGEREKILSIEGVSAQNVDTILFPA